MCEIHAPLGFALERGSGLEKYSLRFADASEAGERTVKFYAHSTTRALELAQETACGDWAELAKNGKAICKMRLVEETGVWLVQPASTEAGCAAQ